MSNVSKFYDGLAEDYHLIASGWDDEVRRQGELISNLLATKFGVRPGDKLLDSSCGIGTQAIGLALNGYQVTGSDISPKEIQRATDEAKRLGASVDFRIADFRTRSVADEKQFSAVVSFDNAIAHLRNESDLAEAFRCMKQKLKADGVLLVSVRDYDELRQARPTGTVPRMIDDLYGKRIYFQTWDWNESGSEYSVNLFVLRSSAGSWMGEPHQTQMRAFTAGEILGALRSAGFADAARLSVGETGYYQPVYAAVAD